MSDVRELYQSVILDHSRKPRNFREPEQANREAEGFNPLCGDKVKVFVKLEDDRLEDVAFQGSGCAISTASASLMTEAVKGRRRSEAEALFRCFRGLVTGEAADAEQLGKLTVLAGVRDFPMRVKCATLAWHALSAALADRHEVISTE